MSTDHKPVIRLGRELDSASVEVIVAELSRGVLLEAGLHNRLTIDMSDVRWAYPTGIVGVLALLDYMTTSLGWVGSAHFGKAAVRMPTWHDSKLSPAGFLTNIGFVNHCERMSVDTNKTEIPYLDRQADLSTPRRYLDLRRVYAGAEAGPNGRDDFLAEVNSEVLTRFRRWLAEKTSLASFEPSAVIGAAAALQELVMNVFDHSSSGGFAYAQQCVRRSRKYLAVVVADTGPGIPHSIRVLAEAMDRPDISQGEALRLASERFATSTPHKIRDGIYGGGVGLSIVQEVADETGGIVSIRSGAAAAHYRSGRMSIYEQGHAVFPGTFVSLYIPFLTAVGTTHAVHN